MCVRLRRLAELPGLLVTEFLVGGGPRREAEGRCWRGGAGGVNAEEPSPSSDAKSVTREDIPPTEGGRGIPRTCC